MIIRQEETRDYENIYSVVKKAFGSAVQADGNEQDLVNALRNGDAYIPELSLVAEIDGVIVGHIMFTKAKVEDKVVRSEERRVGKECSRYCFDRRGA